MSSAYHPNLNPFYFGEINSKEKAYWLGFLYADGYITSGYRLQVSLSIKDEILIDRFGNAVSADLAKKRYYGPYRLAGKSVCLNITDRQLISDLKKHGCVTKKSLILTLPDLKDKELELGFLMGLFDGDGGEHSTCLYSGSYALLKGIKFKYQLGFNIKSEGNVHELNLGSKLFRTMLANYPNSLERKRKLRYKGSLLTSDPFEKNYVTGPQPHKFKIPHPTKEELQILLWQKPTTQIAKQLGVSDNAVARWAKQYGCTKPPRGYWTQFQ